VPHIKLFSRQLFLVHVFFFYRIALIYDRTEPRIYGLRAFKDASKSSGRHVGWLEGRRRSSTVVHNSASVVDQCPRVRATDVEMRRRRPSKTDRCFSLRSTSTHHTHVN